MSYQSLGNDMNQPRPRLEELHPRPSEILSAPALTKRATLSLVNGSHYVGRSWTQSSCISRNVVTLFWKLHIVKMRLDGKKLSASTIPECRSNSRRVKCEPIAYNECGLFFEALSEWSRS